MLTPPCFWDKPERRLSGPPGLEERLLAEEQEALEMRLLEWKDGITSTSGVLKSRRLMKSVSWRVKLKSVSSSFRERFGI